MTEHLSENQLARVEALRASRDVQNASHGAFQGSRGPDPVDLIAVARFILTGENPWQPEETDA